MAKPPIPKPKEVVAISEAMNKGANIAGEM